MPESQRFFALLEENPSLREKLSELVFYALRGAQGLYYREEMGGYHDLGMLADLTRLLTGAEEDQAVYTVATRIGAALHHYAEAEALPVYRKPDHANILQPDDAALQRLAVDELNRELRRTTQHAARLVESGKLFDLLETQGIPLNYPHFEQAADAFRRKDAPQAEALAEIFDANPAIQKRLRAQLLQLTAPFVLEMVEHETVGTTAQGSDEFQKTGHALLADLGHESDYQSLAVLENLLRFETRAVLMQKRWDGDYRQVQESVHRHRREHQPKTFRDKLCSHFTTHTMPPLPEDVTDGLAFFSRQVVDKLLANHNFFGSLEAALNHADLNRLDAEIFRQTAEKAASHTGQLDTARLRPAASGLLR